MEKIQKKVLEFQHSGWKKKSSMGRHLFLFFVLASRAIELCQIGASEWARTRVATPGFELKTKIPKE